MAFSQILGSPNISHQMMISLTPIVSRAKSKWYKPKKVQKLALNSQLLAVQILTNDVQVLILCLSYFITTVLGSFCGAYLFPVLRDRVRGETEETLALPDFFLVGVGGSEKRTEIETEIETETDNL